MYARSDDDNDVVEVPDSVWDAERNRSRWGGERMVEDLRQSSTPPTTACLNIRVIYNNGWIQSSAGGNAALGLQRALDVVAEAQNIFNTKFTSSNQLGTRITFNIVGGGKYQSLQMKEFL